MFHKPFDTFYADNKPALDKLGLDKETIQTRYEVLCEGGAAPVPDSAYITAIGKSDVEPVETVESLTVKLADANATIEEQAKKIVALKKAAKVK